MNNPLTCFDDSVSPWRHLWSLDPTITFLNHGSFGACPIPVLEKQRSFQAQLEQEPVRFLVQELEPLWDAARQELATFVGSDALELVFVPNATTGLNTVLRSLCFPAASALQIQAGDELLTTNQEYNASRNALNVAAELTGAKVVVAEVPFPIASEDQIIEAVLAEASSKTRLVLLDHVSSQTGLIFPIASLAQHFSDRGIDVLVDGAHAPGMIPLNLQELGVAYYTGNCHKWLCAPKGAGFLYVRADRQSAIRPLNISHGANSPRPDRSRFHLEFDWTGTIDPSPYLCIPEAIQFMGSQFPGGWEALMAYNHSLVLAARATLCQVLEIPPPSPKSLTGSMAVLPLPHGSAESLHRSLFQQFQIEVQVKPWLCAADRLIRISAQIYNTLADYDQLAEALVKLLASELNSSN